MNKRIHGFLLASALALTLTGCDTSSRSTLWEYKSASTYPEGVGGVVTDYTQQGWQFVSMSAAAAPGRSSGTTVVLLFKRHQVQPAASAQRTGGLLEGAVAFWRFEGSGQDSISHHNLTLGGNGEEPQTLTYTQGKVGEAMSQRGNSASFQLPTAAEMDFNKNFTLSVWLYRESSVYDNDAVFDNGSFYLAKRDAAPWDSRMGVYLTAADGHTLELVDNSRLGEPPLHTWFHVLVFRDGIKLGIKVNNEGTATVDVSDIKLQAGPVTFVGQQQHGYPWQGRLDELCLWNRALSSAEMAALYNDGKGRQP